MSFLRALLGAEDETHGGVLSLPHPVLPGVVQIHVHLARIGMAEPAALDVDHHQGLQLSMEEDQVHPEPGVVEAKPPLAPHKREIIPHFQKEIGEMPDEGLLEFGFGVFVFQVQEFENEGVLDGFLRRGVTGSRRPNVQLEGPAFCAGGAFVESALNLAIQLAYRPATPEGLGFVKGSSLYVVDRQEPNIGRPGEWEPHGRRFRAAQFRRHCLRNWPEEVEMSHLLQVPFRKPATEPLGEVGRETFNEGFAICGTFPSTLLKMDDPPSDLPIGGGHQCVNASGGGGSRGFNQGGDSGLNVVVP